MTIVSVWEQELLSMGNREETVLNVGERAFLKDDLQRARLRVAREDFAHFWQVFGALNRYSQTWHRR